MQKIGVDTNAYQLQFQNGGDVGTRFAPVGLVGVRL